MSIKSFAVTLDKLQQRAEQYFLQENYMQAANLYEQAIEVEPDIKSHYWNLGLMLLLQGQDVEAQTTWFMAIVGNEIEEVEKYNRELVQILQKEAERREEIKEYDIALKIRQQIKEIIPQDINNLLYLIKLAIDLEIYTGEELDELGIIKVLKLEQLAEVKFELLMEVLRAVLELSPLQPSSIELMEACLPYSKDNLDALLNTFLQPAVEISYSYRQSHIAVKLCELYLSLDNKNTEVLGHLSGFYQNAGDFDKGVEIGKRLYSLLENLPDKIYANRQIIRGLMTAGGYWEEAEKYSNHQESLLALLIKEKPNNLDLAQKLRLYNANYFAPYFDDNPIATKKIQNQIAQICQANNPTHVQEQLEKLNQGIAKRKKTYSSGKKIKLGYISHCLRSHSVGWLARWIFRYRDQDKFQTNGYYINSNPNDALHQWYVNTVDQAYSSNNVFDLAEKIYQDEIDILIDLDSITIDTTCGVLSLKPAPIQVTWLGWDASGIPTVDYFIADSYVLPESAQDYYSEKIWRLPHTYVAVDAFEVGLPTLTRNDLEIPSDAVVYLCAQRGFKRHPDIARLQLNVLKQVDNSYLLIKGLAEEESNKDFFKQLTEEEGVDYSRLRFLPEVPSETSHRANLGIADVVLDTFPYNGATTTMETLWMCIPMVTKVGEQFAARNSYTMMMNAGLTEGIAWSDEEYLEWAVRLGKDEALRQEISWKLRQSRKTSPLWNGKQFTREMEKAYEQMWQKYMEAE